VRDVDLPASISLAVAMTAIHHEDLGKSARAQQPHCVFNRHVIKIWAGLASAPKNEMSIGVSGGFQDRWRAFLCQRREEVPPARSLDGVDGYLNIAVCAVFDSHRHRQT